MRLCFTVGERRNFPANLTHQARDEKSELTGTLIFFFARHGRFASDSWLRLMVLCGANLN